MRRRFRRAARLAAGLVAGAIVAIGGVAQAAAVTLEFWTAYNEAEHKVLVEQVLPEFEKQNPGIKVNATRLGYSELREKLIVASSGGAAPDVARLDIIWSPEFASSGLLYAMDRLPGFNRVRDGVFPGPLSTNRWKGQFYGLPLDTNTQVYLYNATLFNQSGLNPPQSFADFRTVSSRLTRSNGDRTTVWGYALPGSGPWYTLPWIWSNGGGITDPEITRARGHVDSAASVSAIEMLLEMYQKGVIAPTVVGQGEGTWEGLQNGHYAAFQDGPWAAKGLRERGMNDLGLRLMPAGPGGSISVVGGENIGILAGSKHPEAAWGFVQFMLSPKAQLIMATAGQMPVVRGVLDAPEMRSHPFYGTYLQQLLTARARTPHPRWNEMDSILGGALADVFAGKAPARPALEEAARRIEVLLQPGR